MNESDLRALIREVVARHLAEPGGAMPVAAAPSWKAHVSHQMLPVVTGQQSDGPCIVEPTVKCNHCGFCQSLGH